MGGDIWVESVFGKGTSFFIEFKTRAQVSKEDLKQFEINSRKLNEVQLGADLNYERDGV